MICEKSRRLLAERKIALHIAHVPLFLFVWHVMWAHRAASNTRLTLSRWKDRENRPFVVVVFRWRQRQWQVWSVRDFPPTNKHRYLFSFFLLTSFFYFFIHTPCELPQWKQVPSTRHAKTYQFTLDLQTFSYCEIIKYSSIDFNSPRRVYPTCSWRLEQEVKLLCPFRKLCVRISFAPI